MSHAHCKYVGSASNIQMSDKIINHVLSKIRSIITFSGFGFYIYEMETYLHVKCEKVLRSVSVRFAITSGDFGPMMQRVVNKDVTS